MSKKCHSLSYQKSLFFVFWIHVVPVSHIQIDYTYTALAMCITSRESEEWRILTMGSLLELSARDFPYVCHELWPAVTTQLVIAMFRNHARNATMIGYNTPNFVLNLISNQDKLLCRFNGTSFEVITENKEQVELSFKRTWDTSLQGEHAPLNINIRSLL